jgi:prepilin-type N-terminal cleavage/methylation domain-containing protein
MVKWIVIPATASRATRPALRGHRSQKGFTLIELLAVIGITGVLGGLALTSFYVYRSDAYYATVEAAVRNGITSVEAGLTADPAPGAVSLVTQAAPGFLTDSNASSLMPGFRVPKSSKVRVAYDPSCVDGSCSAVFLQINHCKGDEYIQWMKMGSGVDVLVDRVAGEGCP